MTKQLCHVCAPRLVGFVALLALAMPAVTAMSAEAVPEITIEIQHSSPIDIISAQSKANNGTANVSGLVRHSGEPGRDEIFGHVVAEYRTASGDGARLDVPLTPYEAGESGREARFSFNIPRIPNMPMTVQLRYVQERL